MLFVTDYPHPGRPRQDGFGYVNPHRTTLFARDRDHAEELARKRGLDEHIQSVGAPPYYPTRPWICSELLRNGEFAKATHAGCWLSMIAVASGVRSGFELLCDDGTMHELTHFVDALTTHWTRETLLRHPDFTRLLDKVMRLEQEVPGMFPLGPEDFLDHRLPPWHPSYDPEAEIAAQEKLKRAMAATLTYKADFLNEEKRKLTDAARHDIEMMRKILAGKVVQGTMNFVVQGKTANTVVFDDLPTAKMVAKMDADFAAFKDKDTTVSKCQRKLMYDTDTHAMRIEQHFVAVEKPGAFTPSKRHETKIDESYDAGIAAYLKADRMLTTMMMKMEAGGVVIPPNDLKKDAAFALRDKQTRKWLASLYGPIMKPRANGYLVA